MTIVGSHGEGLPISVDSGFETRKKRHRGLVGFGQDPHFEDIARAGRDAVLLALAAIAIDDRDVSPGWLRAFLRVLRSGFHY
jgi:hypothetical protein